jgi:hypothetical protein
MTRNFRALSGMAVVFATAAACTPEQRDTVDSAAGSAVTATRTALSIIDVDMGRHADSSEKITDKTDEFSPSDTIFASVHTSGTATEGQLTARWTFPDGSVVEDKAGSGAAATNDYAVFFITKPGGLAPGKYTFRALVDGSEVRSKDVTVK